MQVYMQSRIAPGNGPLRIQGQEKASLFQQTYMNPSHFKKTHMIQICFFLFCFFALATRELGVKLDGLGQSLALISSSLANHLKYFFSEVG